MKENGNGAVNGTLNELDKKKFLKTVALVAAPIAAQSLIGSSLNLVDNLMIGHLGELPLNAVGVSVQIFFIYWMFVFGFASGAATYIAQFFGVKDFVNIRRTTGFCLTVAFGMGMMFFLAAELFPQYLLRIFTRFPEVIEAGTIYVRVGAFTFLLVPVIQSFTVALRATQQTVQPLIASSVALGMNTLMNYVLIYGKFGAPAMGVAGAALATVISRCVELSIILFLVFGRRNAIAGSFREYFSYSRDLAMRIVRNALPTTINETMWGIGTALYVAAFARISISAGAAVQACNTINNLFSLLAFSIGDAVLILAGQKLGEGKKEEAFEMSRIMTLLAVSVGLVLGALTLCFGKPILSLFDFTPEGAADAWRILIVYAAAMFLEVFNGTMVSGTLRSGGDTRYAMITEVSTVWLIGVPLAFITSLWLGWPVYLAVLAVKGEEVVKGILLLRRYLSKKWLNTVIEGVQ
ncbi:MAG: MATE family efflux transporter [Firmicutes bacterium]|nr:MATE family efflux transporter [Bacillota bacterium]MBQ9016523.1 MATE family efflux transporter [Bacillota bacterium]